MADRTITITWSPRTTHHFNKLSSATHRGGFKFKIPGAIRLPSGDLRQPDQSGRRTRRDLPGEAVGQLGRQQNGNASCGRRAVRAQLRATRLAARVSESSLLRLDESQLQAAIGKLALAGLAMERLDVLARQCDVPAPAPQAAAAQVSALRR